MLLQPRSSRCLWLLQLSELPCSHSLLLLLLLGVVADTAPCC
jgi:hypothetical protein